MIPATAVHQGSVPDRRAGLREDVLQRGGRGPEGDVAPGSESDLGEAWAAHGLGPEHLAVSAAAVVVAVGRSESFRSRSVDQPLSQPLSQVRPRVEKLKAGVWPTVRPRFGETSESKIFARARRFWKSRREEGA